MVFHCLLAALLPPLALGPGDGGRDDWLELDREIEGLHAALHSQESSVDFYGVLRTTYASGDETFANGVDELNGFTIRNARVGFRGRVEDYEFRISADGRDGSLDLADAYVSNDLCGSLKATVGRYKQPFLYAGRVSFRRQLFFERTVPGDENNGRDLGAMVEGGWNFFHWIASVQNGVSEERSGHLLVGHLRADLLGSPFDDYEGAYGSEGLNFGLGLSVGDDDGVDNGTKIGAELEVSSGPLYLHADAVRYDPDYDVATAVDPDSTLGTSKADTTPISVTLSYLLGDSQYEVAARLDVFDIDGFLDDNGAATALDAVRTTLGFAWYVPGFGHDLKWLVNYTDLSADSAAIVEGSKVEIGVQIVW